MRYVSLCLPYKIPYGTTTRENEIISSALKIGEFCEWMKNFKINFKLREETFGSIFSLKDVAGLAVSFVIMWHIF